jgi:predicted N-acetyltransferase YhbS
MKIRKALTSELDLIYAMGFDAWGENQSTEDYLTLCRASPKYKAGQWFVLESASGELHSSLIVYSFSPTCFGIGSISTKENSRKQGYAAALIRGVVQELENAGATEFFLYSDIQPQYYEQFGFRVLPEIHQKTTGSKCMYRGPEKSELESPSYF